MRAAGDPPRSLAVCGALLFVLALVAYLPALRGAFLWDDYDWIVDNALLRSGGGLRRIWLEPRSFEQYYPLTHTTFWVEHRLWADWTPGYHLVNVALHALSAFLFWRVLVGLGLRGALVAAAIFTLHPVAVESVAWIAERKNVLSLALALASLWAWLPFVRDAEARPIGTWRHAAAAALFGLALLAKTVVAPLPGVLLLLRWWKHGRVRGVDVAAVAPLFVAGAALGALTTWLEEVEVGAHGLAWSLTPLERGLVAGRALWFYAGTLVLPTDLAFVYPRWTVSAAEPAQLVPPVAAVAALAALFALRGRLGRGPFVAAAAFAGVLGPALGFVDVYAQVYAHVADRWAYHAAPVAIAALVHGAAALSARLPSAAVGAASVLVVGALGGLTWRQAGLYRDEETLFRAVLAENPTCVLAHGNLGVLAVEKGDLDAARAHFTEALRHDPGDEVANVDLGAILEHEGRATEAAAHYERALARAPSNTMALLNLAGLLARSRDPGLADPARAVALAERAMEVQGDQAPAKGWSTLATAYAKVGRLDDAREASRRGLARARAEGNARLIAQFERNLAPLRGASAPPTPAAPPPGSSPAAPTP